MSIKPRTATWAAILEVFEKSPNKAMSNRRISDLGNLKYQDVSVLTRLMADSGELRRMDDPTLGSKSIVYELAQKQADRKEIRPETVAAPVEENKLSIDALKTLLQKTPERAFTNDEIAASGNWSIEMVTLFTRVMADSEILSREILPGKGRKWGYKCAEKSTEFSALVEEEFYKLLAVDLARNCLVIGVALDCIKALLDLPRIAREVKRLPGSIEVGFSDHTTDHMPVPKILNMLNSCISLCRQNESMLNEVATGEHRINLEESDPK